MFKLRFVWAMVLFVPILLNSQVYSRNINLLGRQFETTTITDRGKQLEYYPRLISICSIPFADT
jgi:hypothetical protein